MPVLPNRLQRRLPIHPHNRCEFRWRRMPRAFLCGMRKMPRFGFRPRRSKKLDLKIQKRIHSRANEIGRPRRIGQ